MATRKRSCLSLNSAIRWKAVFRIGLPYRAGEHEGRAAESQDAGAVVEFAPEVDLDRHDLTAVDSGHVSQPQDLPPERKIIAQIPRRPGMDHAAPLQRDRAVGQREREIEIVIDDDDRDL